MAITLSDFAKHLITQQITENIGGKFVVLKSHTTGIPDMKNAATVPSPVAAIIKANFSDYKTFTKFLMAYKKKTDSKAIPVFNLPHASATKFFQSVASYCQSQGGSITNKQHKALTGCLFEEDNFLALYEWLQKNAVNYIEPMNTAAEYIAALAEGKEPPAPDAEDHLTENVIVVDSIAGMPHKTMATGGWVGEAPPGVTPFMKGAEQMTPLKVKLTPEQKAVNFGALYGKPPVHSSAKTATQINNATPTLEAPLPEAWSQTTDDVLGAFGIPADMMPKDKVAENSAALKEKMANLKNIASYPANYTKALPKMHSDDPVLEAMGF